MFIPGWLFTLGKLFTDKTNIFISILPLLGNLMATIGPFILGVFLSSINVKLKEKLENTTKVFAVFFTFLFLFVIITTKLYIFQYYSYKILWVSLIPWIGFSLGTLTSYFLKLNKQQGFTISLETGFQNIGVALLILIQNIPIRELDYALIILFNIAFITPLPIYILPIVQYIVVNIMNYYGCYNDPTKIDEEDIDYMFRQVKAKITITEEKRVIKEIWGIDIDKQKK